MVYRNKNAKFSKSKNQIDKNKPRNIIAFKDIKLQTNITIISVFVTVLVVLGSSYAAFVWSNTSSSQTITSGDFSIIIDDTSPTLGGSVSLTNAYPSTSEEYDATYNIPYRFKITNNSNKDMGFVLKLDNDTSYSNTLSRDDITINMKGDKIISTQKLSNLIDNTLDYGVLGSKDSKTYELRLFLSTNASNNAIGKTFNGKLSITGNQTTTRNTSLANAIKTDNTLNTKSPSFSTTSTDKGLFKGTDDEGTTYYYRGSVENNYVKLGTYKEQIASSEVYASSGDSIFWRIVRINGDGTIRLISQTNISGPVYWDSDSSMGNYNNSSIKTYVENWYNSNMKVDSNVDNVVVTGTYCNDISNSKTAAYSRMVNKNPIFTCPSGANKISSKIGLITSDELIYSGLLYNENGSSYISADNTTIYTISPYNTLIITLKAYNSFMGLNTGSSPGARPVINLKNDVTIKSGIGTKNDPYIININ